jgi:hypothetical protein
MPVHLVFVTKYRRGVFNDEMLTRCEEVTRKVCEDFEAELKEFSKLVNSLKGVSARRIRVVRRSTSGDRPPVHRAAKTSTPACGSQQSSDAFHPRQ